MYLNYSLHIKKLHTKQIKLPALFQDSLSLVTRKQIPGLSARPFLQQNTSVVIHFVITFSKINICYYISAGFVRQVYCLPRRLRGPWDIINSVHSSHLLQFLILLSNMKADGILDSIYNRVQDYHNTPGRLAWYVVTPHQFS